VSSSRIPSLPGGIHLNTLSDFPGPAHKVAWAFVTNLHEENQRVLFVFAGLMRAWQKQVGMHDTARTEELMETLDKDYVPLVDNIFFEKDSE
jgi:hypothetical protein